MDTPLSDVEHDKLKSILNQFQDENVMSLEGVDGLFTALICSPEMTQPNIYLREIWGDKGIPANEELKNDQETQTFMILLMRHWNTVATKLEDDVFAPVLLDAAGTVKGNAWAHGFSRGISLHQADWSELIDDKEKGAALLPIMDLAHANDPKTEPVSEERRAQLIAGLSVGALKIYKYFEPHRRLSASNAKAGRTVRRETAKVGRNEPCPCGSGRKFKRCCGDGTLN